MTDGRRDASPDVPLSGPDPLTEPGAAVDTHGMFRIQDSRSTERNAELIGTFAFRAPHAGPISLADLPLDAGRSVLQNGHLLAIFRTRDGEVVALDGRCLHRDGPVADGVVRDGVVTCPWHFWRYELATGTLIGDHTQGLRRYPAEVRDGIVHVDLPPAPDDLGWKERLLAAARARDDDEGGAGR